MMKKYLFLVVVLCSSIAAVNSVSKTEKSKQFQHVDVCTAPDWGFFGHRRINRMAVFTLPPEMMVFYKKHIEFITDHAVDPDKRRYATRHEAVRHYIDIDQWGTYPFENVPRIWTDALLKYAELSVITQRGDTLEVIDKTSIINKDSYVKFTKSFLRRFKKVNLDSITYDTYRSFFSENILEQYYEDKWVVNLDSLNKLIGHPISVKESFAKDHFSEHGILPFHLEKMQNKLTEAFINLDAQKILRLSAEFGHYIGDAHVPLHTTTNYNGQLTNQVGIHGFWESRIPELFADKEFDFFVGKADYFEKSRDYYWDIVLTSHSYVDSVLQIEKDLSKTFPSDQQYCYDDRLEATIRTQCKAYAAAFNKRMEGMVEERMRGSISAIGNAWYTAWVDAGQPDLRGLVTSTQKTKEDEALDKARKGGAIKGREH